ncbi:MAG: hypothetical protein AUH85_01570 [Chloroflexi bacterium 13_1_40CM_4_68_4]|nr:MAG: hypothetical protein AUH85_01570 [Chloroflexi bacterium 13_1_40CM_4_68_4]
MRFGEAYGVHAGPIWFIGFASEQRSAQVVFDAARPDAPTKFLLRSDGPLAEPIRISGRYCTDSTALRFEYALASEADGTIVVPQSSQAIAEPGYIFFSRPGRCLVEVRADGRFAGNVVFEATTTTP